MKVLVIDAQGGGIGKQLVSALKQRLPEIPVMAVGTNFAATSAMLKAGADHAATGENAVVFNASRAGLILGPIGIVLANGIWGEISPAMAAAVSSSDAVKILIPSSTCGLYVAGTEGLRMEEYLHRAVEQAVQALSHQTPE